MSKLLLNYSKQHIIKSDNFKDKTMDNQQETKYLMYKQFNILYIKYALFCIQ